MFELVRPFLETYREYKQTDGLTAHVHVEGSKVIGKVQSSVSWLVTPHSPILRLRNWLSSTDRF
jgi:hypothetical protein